MGRKSQLKDYVDKYHELGRAMFEDKDATIIAGFNQLHDLPEGASLEDTLKVYRDIGNKFKCYFKI